MNVDSQIADSQISVRDAVEGDVEQIRRIFQAAYGDDYAFPQFFDAAYLKKQIFSDDCMMLVAVDESSGELLGTGSVVFDVGAFTDLLGEFGRLVVHPDGRGRGIATELMNVRLARVAEHLHVGLADNRVEHVYSQKISLHHGFAPVGYLPIHNGEPVALFARFFNDSLSLRRNHPHIAPPIHWLADAAMRNVGLTCDVIVDESAVAYPSDDDFEVEEMTAKGYARLLRFERGRLRNRGIFGPVKLHFGSRALRRHNTNYLLAKCRGQLVGAIGYSRDPNIDNAVRIFELIHLNERPVRYLLSQLEHRCRKWGVDYIETDVSADAPRLQKTLLELGFLPLAYVPAGVFHYVERLDVVRMARYFVPLSMDNVCLVESMQPIARRVIENFRSQWIEPMLAAPLPQTFLFQGLNTEQTACLANLFQQVKIDANQPITHQGARDGKAYVLIAGTARIVVDKGATDVVSSGEFVGEFSLLNNAPHGADVRTLESCELAMIKNEDLTHLIQARGDIGCILYRNLAIGLGEKLKRSAIPEKLE
ncbi:MAG: GNAT family N-acetyltransferase [Pirellulaceae bacterium]|nr:GNAT family N-acetyltransferase [Pirellulaceae bacterium]